MKKAKSNPVMKSAKQINHATNNRWKQIESTNGYKMAASRELTKKATNRIKEDILDGIFVELSERYQDKSWSVQKRVLRRIVEKRQAQANALVFGTCRGRFIAHENAKSTRRCIKSIDKERHALWAA